MFVMKLRKKGVLPKIKHKAAVVGGIIAGTSMQASAALDPTVTTAFSDTNANITEAGTLIITLAAVAMGFRWVKATFF